MALWPRSLGHPVPVCCKYGCHQHLGCTLGSRGRARGISGRGRARAIARLLACTAARTLGQLVQGALASQVGDPEEAHGGEHGDRADQHPIQLRSQLLAVGLEEGEEADCGPARWSRHWWQAALQELQHAAACRGVQAAPEMSVMTKDHRVSHVWQDRNQNAAELMSRRSSSMRATWRGRSKKRPLSNRGTPRACVCAGGDERRAGVGLAAAGGDNRRAAGA